MLKNIRSNVLLFLISPCRISLVWVPWVLCIVGFTLSMLTYYPGKPVMLMLHEARTGVYTDWHPPIMAATIRCLFQICPNELLGLGTLYVVVNVLFWSGFLLVLLSGKPFWANKKTKKNWMVVVTLLLLLAIWIDILVVVSPFLSKDFTQLACLLLATGMLLNLSRKPICRMLVGVFILLLLFYGTMLRYNAVLGLLPMLYWLSLAIAPSKRFLSLLSACLLWYAFFSVSYAVNYHILHAYRFYSLHERFYADIFMLNYFGSKYENPPNGFLNKFDDISEESFRKNYLYRHMYVPEAFRYVSGETGRSFNLVYEGVQIVKENEPKKKGAVTESCIQTFANDYITLRNVWIRRIFQEPLSYITVRSYFVLRFFFIDTPPIFMLVTCGTLSGVSLLAITTLLSFRVKHLFASPYVLLAWCTILNGLPLFVFLPDDGPGNIRYLYWFYATAFISVTCFCSQSNLFSGIVNSLQKFLENKVRPRK